ncbi:MAG: UDP-GlcNAc:undecaprenyl-phosphate/decaprenyl-phosphate GlcNAc-phosphate transferase [Actinomycetota bacterium]|nr:UDP-GlcNAc:undecaprenyl-phosphate/decaprenyl-phosphate GlcNAc-phosphate transferase [Actinomycetota bacterium]
MRAYLYVMIVAAAVTYLLTPLSRRIARRIGAITPVRERDVHAVPVPRMGGTAMLLGFAVAMVVAWKTPFFEPVFSTNGGAPWGVLLGATAVCLLGVADDLWTLDAVTKLAGQSIAAGLMAWKGVQFVILPIAGVTILSPWMLMSLTVLTVIVAINAVNFVDGLDGLAAGIVGIAGSAFFVYSYLLARQADRGDYSSLPTLITAALVGCCLGFLPHNFNPARIFMGDSGSMLIGLLLAAPTIALTGTVDPATISVLEIAPAFFPLVLPIAILALPLIDLMLAVIRRTRAGQAPWQADKSHLHHRLLRLGHSHASAVLIMYAWTATLAFGVAMTAFNVVWALAAGAVAAVLAFLLTIGPVCGRRGFRGHVP